MGNQRLILQTSRYLIIIQCVRVRLVYLFMLVFYPFFHRLKCFPVAYLLMVGNFFDASIPAKYILLHIKVNSISYFYDLCNLKFRNQLKIYFQIDR